VAGFLKVTAIGNLGRVPEKRYGSSGKPNLRFSMAATKRVRGRDGEWEDETDWLSCIVFGNPAESLSDKLEKGSRVYIEGRLHLRAYETQSGSKGSSLDVVVTEIQLLTTQPRSNGGDQSSYYDADADDDLGPAQPRPSLAGTSAPRGRPAPQADPSDLEDLPF
jgi:single-strand DNA-binding protein